eukprot:9487007-Pyramimonas_sp.AAC.1
MRLHHATPFLFRIRKGEIDLLPPPPRHPSSPLRHSPPASMPLRIAWRCAASPIKPASIDGPVEPVVPDRPPLLTASS